MRTFIILFIITIFCFLYSQVNFEFDFTINKINDSDNLKSIWLQDLNNDNIEEIIACYSNNYTNDSLHTWRIVVYNQIGEILSYLEDDYPNESQIQKCSILSYQNTMYLFTSFKREEIDSWFTYNYLDLKTYDFNSFELISEYSEEIGYTFGPESGTVLSSINFINPVIIDDILNLYLGITIFSYSSDDFSSWNSTETEIRRFSLNNDIFEPTETITDCGNASFTFDYLDGFISVGYYHSNSTSGMGDGSSSSKEYDIKRIIPDIDTEVIPVFGISGSSSSDIYNGTSYNNYPDDFDILTNNDFTFSIHGLMIHYEITDDDMGTEKFFRNFSPDLTETSWISNSSNLSGSIIASTCVVVNDIDQSVMYFDPDQFEIRNRVNGDIDFCQDSPNSPYRIFRKTDGDLLFLFHRDDDTGYDVYVLESDIYLSSEDYSICEPPYSLNNYPNPFNPETVITYQIKQDCEVQIEIFNVKGQKIRTLNHQFLVKGKYKKVWDGRNDIGRIVNSGLYFINLNVNGKLEEVQKCLLLK